MWTRPRSTVATLVAAGTHPATWWLAAALGIRIAVAVALTFVLGDQLPWWALTVLVLAGGAALGAGLLQLGSLLLLGIGRLFGGAAEATDIRTALAWSYVPHAFALVGIAGQMLLTGGSFFTSDAVAAGADPLLGGALWALTVLGWGLTLWSLYLAVQTYAAVQDFSLWLSLTAHLIVLLLEVGLFALLGLLLVLSGIVGA